ncbi:hypothetical protein EDD16DRAFT_1526642 [Pisolithus croceorrhizus]|nr:hypothetical protein EDD16DRAFT_1526642 [Pisolithus croceorrhizus]KAI6161689.1 hypothetical protein EDD17DRAFT_1508805 [Pisolithus thermaeus]
MTASYIVEVSGSLQFKSALITFCCLHGKHTGKALTHTMLYLLDHAGVTAKAGHFLMDNTKKNGVMMGQLAGLHSKHIMCFTHIINLCVQDVTSKFTAASTTDEFAEGWAGDTLDKDGDAGHAGRHRLTLLQRSVPMTWREEVVYPRNEEYETPCDGKEMKARFPPTTAESVGSSVEGGDVGCAGAVAIDAMRGVTHCKQECVEGLVEDRQYTCSVIIINMHSMEQKGGQGFGVH